MSRESGTKGAPYPYAETELDWIGVHLPELRRNVSGQHFLYWSLGIAFVVGLATHVGGYILKLSATTGPLGLLADLLYALGWALWTGVVVVMFVQVVPEVKRRQIKEAIDEYEAHKRDKAQDASDQTSADDGAPSVS
jgi:hypothetical protein